MRGKICLHEYERSEAIYKEINTYIAKVYYRAFHVSHRYISPMKHV